MQTAQIPFGNSNWNPNPRRFMLRCSSSPLRHLHKWKALCLDFAMCLTQCATCGSIQRHPKLWIWIARDREREGHTERERERESFCLKGIAAYANTTSIWWHFVNGSSLNTELKKKTEADKNPILYLIRAIKVQLFDNRQLTAWLTKKRNWLMNNAAGCQSSSWAQSWWSTPNVYTKFSFKSTQLWWHLEGRFKASVKFN